MTDVLSAAPPGADELVARDLAAAFVGRRTVRARALLAAGIAIFAAGLAGFGIFGGRQDALARNGVHTTARVTATALYGGRFSRNSFNEHIDVEFAYPGGFARNVRIYVGENTNYRVGQQLEVVYDPANPKRAVLAHGTRDVGPIGVPFFVALVTGVIVAVFGIRGIRLTRGARRSLGGPSRTMTASTRLRRLGRTRTVVVDLAGAEGGLVEIPSATRKGWWPLLEPVEAVVLGPLEPGRVLVVVDPVRRVVTAGRLPRVVTFALPGDVPAVRRVGGVAVVVGGLVATVALVVWAVHTEHRWQESDRIQAGPRALGVIAATGAISGHSQAATLRYSDAAGGRHLVALRYPLGLAASAIPGMSTTVAYDPAAPGLAEVVGHPRASRLTFAATVVLAVGATVAWLALAVLLLSGGRRRGATVVLVPAAALGVLALGTLAVSARRVPFPPPPPRAAAVGTAAADLPPILSAAPPASGPLVTPGLAHAVAAAAWPVRDRAVADHDLATLRAVEAGPALAVDVARMNTGLAPNLPAPASRAPDSLTAYVPRQTRWPLRFLAEAVTTTEGEPWIELQVYARPGPRAPWRVVYDTGYGPAAGTAAQVEPGIVDRDGYDVVPPVAWLDPADVVPHLARYWQAWLERGATVASVPSFLPGWWTSRYVAEIAGQQDKRGLNGLVSHVAYGDRPAPRSQVWTFGVFGNVELVCSPMHQTTVYGGGANQDGNRAKWGSELPPGDYSTITAESLREPCVLVPSAPGGLVAFGANRTVVATRGDRAG